MGWQETRQWCFLCGKRRLRGIVEQKQEGGATMRLRLLGEPTRCRVDEACRWEGRARAATLAEIAEDEMLESRSTP